MIRRLRALRSERGSTTLELVICTALLLILGLLIAAGRLAIAGNAVQSAAFAAARDASLARTTASAQSAGDGAANFSLNSNGVTCITRSVALDLSNFDTPLGTTGRVVATLQCTVSLADAGLPPGLPGTAVIERSATSPVDPPYRQRTP